MHIPRVTNSILVKTLLVAALVAVLLPACAQPLSGRMQGMEMGSGLAGLLGCPQIYYPADAPAALTLEVMTLMFIAVFAALALKMAPLASVSRGFAFSTPTGEPPGPPDDPLRGRLII